MIKEFIDDIKKKFTVEIEEVEGVGVEIAKSICEDCPVAGLCLEYALTYRIDHGVWGGCSERQRRRIRKERRQLVPAA